MTAALLTSTLAGFVMLSCGSKSGMPVLTTCVSYSAEASLAPLDVLVTIDTSGSMDFATANGTPKIDAVANALGQFLLDPASAGIGVTISFFPVIAPGIPELCASDEDCKQAGACTFVSTCSTTGGSFCHTAADCEGGDECEALGRCADDPEIYCLVPSGLGCLQGVACEPVGVCINRAVCDESSYAPVLPIAPLPEAAYPLLDALAAHPPDGGTPTRPALAAALAAAKSRAAEFPEHKVIVLLATDGLPTACDPAVDPVVVDPDAGLPAIQKLASDASGVGVQTFVIGVFAPEESADASTNLSQIAQAGGSGSAFVISTQEDVSELFLETLTEIRRKAKACEFSLPAPDGQSLDATLLQVTLIGDGSTTRLEPTKDGASCDPTTGGFYFDADPFGPVPPGRITLCPASCALAENGSRQVSLTVDCDQTRLVWP